MPNENESGRSLSPAEVRIRTLYEAASWLAAFDQDLPDLDRPTCQRLAAGMKAMAESAERRHADEVTPARVQSD